MIAKSAIIHSGLEPEIIATLSSGFTPMLIK